MPFVQLQHPKDVALLDSEYEDLFKKVYKILYDNLDGISTFKASVYISHYSFVITKAKEKESFIYLKISLLKKANRTDDVKNKIGAEVLKTLQESFSEKVKTLNINGNPSVEIGDTHHLYK